ncbi:MAG: hypothetical protein EI684_09485 [Candidatus Viridilinea halotolerans]|uniref:ATP-binding protein n=1 Tax=Candidatus Viridilinea halotolerans TaxID=2491704 RepID=A0A426U137_9CHLR|nr:MAG: hypothetical protein EI684_09485 [Candidatus Viridilinea halotolerans]
MSIEVVVGAATEAVFGYLLEHGLAAQLRQRLQPDPFKAAFRLALTRAFNQFAHVHPQLVAALFDQHLLTRPAVAQLLAQSIERDHPPDAAALAALYAEQLGTTPERRAALQAEITPAAATLLTALRSELRRMAEFQPLFDSQALDQVALHTGATASEVAAMRQTLDALAQATRDLHQQIIATKERTVMQHNSDARAPHAPPTTAATQIGRAPRSKPNPFIAGSAVPPERFYGRAHERQAIRARIGALTAQSISLVGHFRSGKSSLLEYVLARRTEFCSDEQNALVAKISMADSRYRSALGISDGLRRAIYAQTGEPPWEADENDDTYALEDGLARLARQGRRTILLIDEFCAFDDTAQFYRWGDDWRTLAQSPRLALALVIASHRPLHEIYEQRQVSSPFGNIFLQERLRPFAPDEVLRLLRDGFATNDEQPSAADEALVAELAGGWPFYVQLAASLLWHEGEHTAVRDAFAHQAQPHFVRLWRSLLATEQAALRALVSAGQAPSSELQTSLREQGLLRADGQLFSPLFAAYVRGL